MADVTNAVAAFYVQQNDRMRSEEAIRTTRVPCAAQLADAKAQLDRHEAAMRDYTTPLHGRAAAAGRASTWRRSNG